MTAVKMTPVKITPTKVNAAKILGILFAASLCVAPAAAQEAETKGQISIAGQGIITATPDMATLNSGVQTDGKTAKEALDANTAAMSQLIDVLKSAGIEDRDIQTSGFSVQPIYVRSKQLASNGYTKAPKIDGYRVFNQVAVRIRDLDILGTVIDRAVTVGANQINGVSFSVAQTGDIFEKARLAAVLDAKKKAMLYTNALGVELANILQISESGAISPQPRALKSMARMEMVADAGMAAPVEAGELTYTMHVNVTWEIAQ